jgi:hypothetical protein
MTHFSIAGRFIETPLPADWREQLTRMLGAKPRRIGTWAELGLFGALRCMTDAGEPSLAPDAQIWLSSRRGTYAATDLVLEQMREDLPMPLAFLQTQPSQFLAMLGAQLQWQGHACFVADAEPQALLRLAAAQQATGGILLGYVDEMDGGSSNWLRLRPQPDAGANYHPAADELFSAQYRSMRIGKAGLELD